MATLIAVRGHAVTRGSQRMHAARCDRVPDLLVLPEGPLYGYAIMKAGKRRAAVGFRKDRRRGSTAYLEQYATEPARYIEINCLAPRWHAAAGRRGQCELLQRFRDKYARSFWCG